MPTLGDLHLLYGKVGKPRIIRAMISAMARVDSKISPSMYGVGNGSEDRPPTGDDYNDLWSAVITVIQGEFKANDPTS